MKKAAAETLNAIAVFQGLALEERKEIADLVFLKTYERHEQIVAQNDNSTDVYFVISGKVRAKVFSARGKEVDYQDLGPGDMFGELSAIDKQRRSAHVYALSESTIASMPEEAFWSAVMSYPSVNRQTLLRLTGLVRMLMDRIFEFSAFRVRHRVHAELLRMADEVPGTGQGEVVVDDAPSQQEFASRVATHREAVNREFKNLEAIGVFENPTGRYVIKDVAELRRMVEEGRGH